VTVPLPVFPRWVEHGVVCVICVDLGFQIAETTDTFAHAAAFFRWASVVVWLIYAMEWTTRMYREIGRAHV